MDAGASFAGFDGNAWLESVSSGFTGSFGTATGMTDSQSMESLAALAQQSAVAQQSFAMRGFQTFGGDSAANSSPAVSSTPTAASATVPDTTAGSITTQASTNLSYGTTATATLGNALSQWKPLKVGGGGVLSGIDVARDGTQVIRTDTYGAYIWSGTEWKQLLTSTSMPASVAAAIVQEGVYELQVSESNSNVMYMMYMGQVLKTTDKGTTWTLTNFTKVAADPNDNYRTNGQKMAIDPNNPNVVFVGTAHDGMFVTRDGGTTWQSVTGVPRSGTDSSGISPGIAGITFNTAAGVTGGNTNTIYASSYGNGVYQSNDGGVTWSRTNGGPADVQYAALSSDGAYYVAANNSSELWKYDHGTWSKLLSSYNYWITAVAVNPLDPSEVVVVGTNSNPNVSHDGGLTWSGFGAVNQTTATDIPWLAGTGGTGGQLGSAGLVFNPLVPNQLITTGGTGVWNTVLPSNWSVNTPVVWNSQTMGIEQLCANQILIAPGGKPVVASWDRAFFYIDNPDQFPTTYGPVANTFVAGWSLDYAASNPNFLVGIADWWGTEQSGYSTDGGQTWHQFATMPAFAGHTIGGTIAASSPLDIVWAPANGFQPYFTNDGGQSWNPVNLPGVSDWSGFNWAYYFNAATVTADRVLADTFYLYYAGQGVFRSTDDGKNWTKLTSGELSPHSYFSSKLESVPGQAGNLFFTGGPNGDTNEPFLRSVDGGATWTSIPTVTQVTVFGFGAPATAGSYPAIYIAGYVNNVYGIWQSNDNAQSWTKLEDYPLDSLAQIRSIEGDPDVYGRVYVGLTGDGFAYLTAPPPGPVPNQAPIVTASNNVLARNQSVAMSTLFAASDPDGNTITTYAVKNVGSSGSLVVNGVVQANNTEIQLTAAQLAQAMYNAGQSAGQLSVRAFDGTAWSAWQNINVTVRSNQAPSITTVSLTVSPNQTVAAGSLFAVSDADGDTITRYTLRNITGNGHLVVNGVVQANQTDIVLTAAQLSQTVYQSGSGSDQLSIRAYDGLAWSAWSSLTVIAWSNVQVSPHLPSTQSGGAIGPVDTGGLASPGLTDAPSTPAPVAPAFVDGRGVLASAFQFFDRAVTTPAWLNPVASAVDNRSDAWMADFASSFPGTIAGLGFRGSQFTPQPAATDFGMASIENLVARSSALLSSYMASTVDGYNSSFGATHVFDSIAAMQNNLLASPH